MGADAGGDRSRRGLAPDTAATEPASQNIRSVLFACTHNAIRSPMAQALMARFAGNRIYSRSVGVFADLPLDGFAAAVMDEVGIDIGRHNPHTFEDLQEWGEDIDQFDLIIALSPAAQRHALEHTRYFAVEVEYWQVEDPTAVEGSRERRLEAYREVRDRLERRIKERFGALRAPVV